MRLPAGNFALARPESEQFTVVAVPSGHVTLANVHSGRRIDVPGGAATFGLRVRQ